MVGLTSRSIYLMTEKGTLPKPEVPGRFPLVATISTIVENLRQEANGQSAEKARDQARQAKADADRAEMAAIRESKQSVFVSEVRMVFADYRVKIRDVLMRSALPVKQREEIADKIAKIRVDDVFPSTGEDE